MRQKGFWLLALGVFVLVFPTVLLSDSHYKVVNGPKEFYYGHVSYAEILNDGKDPVVVREGELGEEIAVVNFPLAPGDIIRTSDARRCELQFDTGTIIRLDLNTELKIETILAQSLSSTKKMSNLLLVKGQVYVMYKEYDSQEMFQVLTQNAAVKMKHNTVALIKTEPNEGTDVQVKNGTAYILFGIDETTTKDRKIGKLERLVIGKDNQLVRGTYSEDSDFEKWNQTINADFERLHEGQSALPKPVQKLPQAVFNFAQNYGDRYGEWIWDDLYGYVWRPFYNLSYPGGSWQPYFYGSWRAVNDQLFWVPGEPWGWVPYHLGIWQWDKKLGWVWLPGSFFAPAWASWDFFMGFYSWRPWSLFDWYLYDSYWGYLLGESFWGSSLAYGNYSWYYNWPSESHAAPSPDTAVRTVIRKDQLKKPDKAMLPLPKEFKGIYKGVVTALKKGDERIVGSFKNIPGNLVMAKGADLGAPGNQKKFLGYNQLSKINEGLFRQKPSVAPSTNIDVKRDAIREVRKDFPKIISLPKQEFFPSEKLAIQPRDFSPILKSVMPPPFFRFRDWNPDIKTALGMGVEILYSSRTNEIRCPQLGLSSANISPHRFATSVFGGGGFFSGRNGSSSSTSATGSGSLSGSIHSEGHSGSAHTGTTTKKD
jgi:hypothetical protein